MKTIETRDEITKAFAERMSESIAAAKKYADSPAAIDAICEASKQKGFVSESEWWETEVSRMKAIKKIETIETRDFYGSLDAAIDAAREESKQRGFVSVKTEAVGRNQPCPCGSGKKFKKCCINKRKEI